MVSQVLSSFWVHKLKNSIFSSSALQVFEVNWWESLLSGAPTKNKFSNSFHNDSIFSFFSNFSKNPSCPYQLTHQFIVDLLGRDRIVIRIEQGASTKDAEF